MHFHDGKTQITSPQNYRDLDGNMRSFTYVDHDPKTKIAVKTEKIDTAKALEEYREVLIQKILNIHASYCATIFMDYTIRGEAVGGVQWNETMLRDKGIQLNQLGDIYTLASNAQELAGKTRF